MTGQFTTVTGWKLDGGERAELVRQVMPRFAVVKADHVTFRANVAADAPLPEPVRSAIVGHATILTGMPRGGWAAEEKVQWAPSARNTMSNSRRNRAGMEAGP
jgi:hypothetical protein